MLPKKIKRINVALVDEAYDFFQEYKKESKLDNDLAINKLILHAKQHINNGGVALE